MFNEFVQVTEINGERMFINLSKIQWVREISKGTEVPFSSIRVEDNTYQVRETIESFEQFFEEQSSGD